MQTQTRPDEFSNNRFDFVAVSDNRFDCVAVGILAFLAGTSFGCLTTILSGVL